MTDTTTPAEPQPHPFDPALPGRIARFLEANPSGETIAIRGTRVLRRGDLAGLLERDRYAEKTRLQLAEACAALRAQGNDQRARADAYRDAFEQLHSRVRRLCNFDASESAAPEDESLARDMDDLASFADALADKTEAATMQESAS